MLKTIYTQSNVFVVIYLILIAFLIFAMHSKSIFSRC